MNCKWVLSGLLLLMALPGINQIAVAEPVEFSAEYIGEYQGLPISARGLRELRKLEDGTYQLMSSAQAMFVSVSEVSEFTIEEGRAVPIRYLYQRQGMGKNRDEAAVFNWPDSTVNHQGIMLDIQPGTLDKLLYQYQLRADIRALMEGSLMEGHLVEGPLMGEQMMTVVEPLFSYQIPDDGRLKEYSFKITGQELLDTPLGDTATVRVDRVRDDDKQTTLWLATEHEYLLVRLRQVKGNKKGFEINLSAINYPVGE